MTSTPARGVDRVHGASGRPPRALDRIPALAIVLGAGLALRLIIAHILFPGSGFESDIGTFKSWADTLATHGPGAFYDEAGFADYPPGYMYVLWVVGMLADLLQGIGGEAEYTLLIKAPPMLADLGVAYLLYRIVAGWSSVPGRDAPRLALLAASFYLFNPVTIYDSALWGQTDSVGALVLLSGVALLLRGNSEGATAAAALAGLVKPQFGVLLAPLVVIVLLRRHLLARGSGPRRRPRLVPHGLGEWLEREQGPLRLVTSAIVGMVVLVVLITPFALDIPGFVVLMAQTAGGYPWLSVNAYNPWALMGAGGTPSLASTGQWSSDTVPFLGPIPGVIVGTALLAGGYLVGLVRLLWRGDRWSILVVATFLGLCFFVLPTRVHERYLFPVFAFLPLLAVASRPWRWALVALSIGSFINLHAVLTTDGYGTPNVVGLPLGELFRSELGVLVSVALHVGVFGFVAWQMRRDAVRRPDPLSRATMAGGPSVAQRADTWTPERPVGSSATDAGALPRWEPEPVGALARLSGKLRVRPVRRDRSAELDREPPGRLDRLDLLLVVVLIVGALTLRGYRLHEPYDMHFDEVYHARTATEFLQHWRYGEPHGIYEYTHPHVAKYAIALGLIAFGNDRVTATSELGVEVRDAAIEQRWSATDAPAERRGDRLYVATGSEVRAYDLQTRQLVAVLPVPATALAVDGDAHRVVMTGGAGALWTLPTDELDAVRRDAAHAVAPPTLLTTLPSGAAVEGLTAVDDAILVRYADGTLTSLDAASGEETGEASIDGAGVVIRIPAVDQVLVDPALVDDVVTLAAALADALAEDQAGIETLVQEADGPVTVAAYFDEDTRTAVQEGIDEGTLTGVSIQSTPALAVGAADGVRLLDRVSLAEIERAGTSGPVESLALVEGLDDPTLYAAVGGELQTIALREAGPAAGAAMFTPGPIREVRWDGASNLVHALGDTQDGAGVTVYVVEPHANAVFADARLPFEPQALLMDAQPERPADDRQDLLALSQTGTMASVDVGSHAFGWRIPGVIMGALMAAAIYLLARTLFQRRSVAVIAAVLVMVEGMAFANARIAMNDTYIATFIVCAVALFAPLYLGIWRRPWAVALVLPVVGVLLGIALGTKWVGAYAIGLVLLLVLLRSALGRVIALVGMIGLTGTLGYLGLRVDEGSTAAPHLNVTFLLLMLGLTVLLAVAMVVRPVRATLDELRFAVMAPVVAGGSLVLTGFVLGPGRIAPGAGPLTASAFLWIGAALLFVAAMAYTLSWVLARWGIGPLAPDGAIGRGEPVPSPAPTGWLRPGWWGGIPWLYAIGCLTVVPIVVYVITYLPWAALGNQIVEGWPPGNTGQTLEQLTLSMYGYHNDLRAGHAAASPWWAWPLDLKPVWFYQDGFADNMVGVIYDTGNLVIFWLAIPAVIFAAWQAWVRRSLALTLVVLGVVVLWVPWARIDRATFQYHVFTSLPFAIIALAYFLAELWHGASSRTFILARAAAALAILGPPLLWLLRLPLCGAAGTSIAHPDGVACGEITRSLTVADNVLVSVAVVAASVVIIGWLMLRALQRPLPAPSPLGQVVIVTALAAAGVAAAQLLFSGAPALTLELRAEEIVLAVLALLAGPAFLAFRARDARRWVVGALGAAALFFIVYYPNLSGLPMPNSIAPAYLGLLPTWNYDFQFAVNLDAAPTSPISYSQMAAVTGATALLCAAAMVAARSRRSDRTARPSGLMEDAAQLR